MPRLMRAQVVRRLRLASGLVMLSYVTMHLVNHATGLISLDAMEWVLGWVFAIWTSLPAQILLYGAFAVHYLLALWALWERRTLRLRPSELCQIVLGFAIPIVLARHVTGTRIADSFFGTRDNYYAYRLWSYFDRSPELLFYQLPAIIIAWGHAMLGLHFWLKTRPGYTRFRSALLLTAVLVPLLALLGVIEGGRRVAAMAAQPGWLAGRFAAMTLPTPQTDAALARIADWLTWFFVAVVVAVLIARVVRAAWQRRHGVVRISYPDGRFVDVVRGTSVLEASRLGRIPHASVCGGRSRCSTCRVRVRTAAGLAPPGETERRVLDRIRAGPSIRLACMLRPAVPVMVTPLLSPFTPARRLRRAADLVHGGEREIAVLFADIRDFTALADGRLPYDVVFILNRYFAAMGRAVEEAGGRVDKFIGDGVMALFGLAGDAGSGCRAALAAARLMSDRLVELNRSLADELDAPLRIGIGIHAGPAIVGEMGYGSAAAITAIGDTVNIASRLEGLTKDHQCELVVSAEVVTRAGLDRSRFHWHEIEIRGRSETLAAAVLDSAHDLPAVETAALQARPSSPARVAP